MEAVIAVVGLVLFAGMLLVATEIRWLRRMTAEAAKEAEGVKDEIERLRLDLTTEWEKRRLGW